MRTYPWHLCLPWPAPHDPDWYQGQCSAWGWHIVLQWSVEVGTPAAGKESPGLSPAFRGWVPTVMVLWASFGGCQEQCSWLTLSPATSTDASSGQQVLQGGGRKHVHRFKWRYSWWWVTWGSYPGHRGAGRGLSGRGHGHIAHRWRHP